VQGVIVVPDEFTTDNGLLTPTLKVRRQAVEDRYAALIEACYTAMTAAAGSA
jgi:long-chain acyl-CoA synthetase